MVWTTVSGQNQFSVNAANTSTASSEVKARLQHSQQPKMSSQPQQEPRLNFTSNRVPNSQTSLNVIKFNQLQQPCPPNHSLQTSTTQQQVLHQPATYRSEGMHHQPSPQPIPFPNPSPSNAHLLVASPNSTTTAAEHAMKMSTAVDGLLSLRAAGTSTGSVGGPFIRPLGQISATHKLPGMVTHPQPASFMQIQHQQHLLRPHLPLPPHLQHLTHSINSRQSEPSPNKIEPSTGSNISRTRSPINMEKLWAGDKTQLPSEVK